VQYLQHDPNQFSHSSGIAVTVRGLEIVGQRLASLVLSPARGWIEIGFLPVQERNLPISMKITGDLDLRNTRELKKNTSCLPYEVVDQSLVLLPYYSITNTVLL
jgi:hypothetical protein